VLEVDLVPYLSGLKKVIVPWVRPKNPVNHTADVKDFRAEMARMPADKLTFTDSLDDRVAAFFHTGGTTGMPKVAQHKVSGMVYNGWLGATLLFKPTDVVICPLPLFHVFACYPILMSMIGSGAHVVFPTPQGYRGEGVFDNFWKLVERYKVTYMITVPTALAALMQRPVNADISSMKNAFSGSSPLPVELYNRFKKETGIEIIEGYGLTEATCLVSINPPDGVKKIGSVGLMFPYCNVRILTRRAPSASANARWTRWARSASRIRGSIEGSTYTEADKNRELFADGRFLRTGDLGRIDADGYLFITGRAKDLIIRGGHNIDPAIIEEALMGHEAVGFVGAIGQPDAHAGELPCAYVELVKGASTTVEDLMAYAAKHISERAAVPKYLEILPELPKTAVGKVFKPDLRRMAITRTYDAALAEAGIPARVAAVIEDKKRGLVAQLSKSGRGRGCGRLGCPGAVLEPLGMGVLIRHRERSVVLHDSKFHLPESPPSGENGEKERSHGNMKMKIGLGICGCIDRRIGGVADAQQSEVLFSHKHWEVSIVGWDDGSVGCVAEVKAPGESFSIWTFPDGAVQLQFYSTAWSFGEGQTADLGVQIDRRAPWNLTGAELYQNSVLFYLPDEQGRGEFHHRGRPWQPAVSARQRGSDVQNYSLAGLQRLDLRR
jgi:fatty-acyl-CoA synthase